jgi:hypothetical protein
MRLFLAATLVAASASTAAVRDAQLVYRAAPGEVNDVLISTAASPDGSSMITVSDPGATIAAGDGCAPADHTLGADQLPRVVPACPLPWPAGAHEARRALPPARVDDLPEQP